MTSTTASTERTKVFVSYAREDESIAEKLVNALEGAGLDVWWDRRLVAGSNYAFQINTALRSVDAVIVVWSGNSVTSEWVYSEAQVARERGSIIPLSISADSPPPPFNTYHTPNVRDVNDQQIATIVEMIQRKNMLKSQFMQRNSKNSKKKRVLCIEGWNWSAFLSCGFIEVLEDELRKLPGSQPTSVLSDHFDLIVGSSWGAITAAAVACGFPASDATDLIRNLYEKGGHGAIWRSLFGKSQFNQGRIAKFLDQKFLGRELSNGSLKTGLLVPLWADDRGVIELFVGGLAAEIAQRSADGINVMQQGSVATILKASIADKLYHDSVVTIGGQNMRGRYSNAGLSFARDPSLLALAFCQSRDGLGWPADPENLILVSAGAAVDRPPLSGVMHAGGLLAATAFLEDNLSASAKLSRLLSASLSDGYSTVYAAGAMEYIAELLRPQKPLCSVIRHEVVQHPELHPSLRTSRQKRLFAAPPQGSHEVADIMLTCARQTARKLVTTSRLQEFFA